MIKIEPYYRRGGEGQALLKMYLRMVADVVPFWAADVLFDDPEGRAAAEKKEKRRIFDAYCAQKLIRAYSEELHDYLYETRMDGHVNQDNLRHLLITPLPGGMPPEELRFMDRDTDPKRSKALQDYVFRYENFSKHKDLYSFVQSLGVEVCPYCNRQFTTTVNEKGQKSRPQLDHFRNKSDYPYLALSINNLVPCCGVCNLIKHDKNEEMIYPYEEEFGEDYVFTMQFRDKFASVMTGAPISPEHLQIELVPSGKGGGANAAKIKASIDALGLDKMYREAHNKYVSALVFQRYITTEAMIDDLYSQFGENGGQVFESKDEVRMALTLMNTEPAYWGERPLAKLTHDIQCELDAQPWERPVLLRFREKSSRD